MSIWVKSDRKAEVKKGQGKRTKIIFFKILAFYEGNGNTNKPKKVVCQRIYTLLGYCQNKLYNQSPTVLYF